MKTYHHTPRRLTALLLVLAVMLSLVPVAFAAQRPDYHDPAEHWRSSLDRTDELDVNAVVTTETFYCNICDKETAFLLFRVPEYSRDGVSAMTRDVVYSDATMRDDETIGTIFDGTPGVDAYYTGCHWTKAICNTCGTLNGNSSPLHHAYVP